MIHTFLIASVSLALIASAKINFTDIVVFGDSLSDNGNAMGAIRLVTVGLINSYGVGYYMGNRCSNGPVYCEELSTAYGATLHDFAWAGASTNNSAVSASVAANPDVPGGIPLNLIVPDVITQVAGYLLQKNASQTARLGTTLFIIVAGGNDVQIAPAIPASGPVSTIGHVISTLKTNGAQHFLLLDLPNFANIPAAQTLPPATVANYDTFTQDFKTQIAALSTTAGTALFSLWNLLEDAQTNPATYGIDPTKIKTACHINDTNICANPQQYIFWDGLHPTTTFHQVAANGIKAVADTYFV